MKGLELKPSSENIKKTLENDTLGRNIEIAQFIRLLCEIDDSFSIAIDGSWGSGKTFFIRQTEMILNSNSNGSLINIDKIPNMDGVKINKLHFRSIYYDSWENDNACDPILSILYTICSEYDEKSPRNRKIGEGVKKSLESIANLLPGKFWGIKLGSQFSEIISKDFVGEKIIDPIEKQKKLHKEINDFFDNLLSEENEKLIIFIDELDRCRPDYAISLMERIKHYFDDTRIIFVFAVNIKQLKYMVQKSYGIGFDGEAYLDRFFNLNLTLPDTDLNKIYSLIEKNIDELNPWIRNSTGAVIRHFDFSLREITRYYLQTKMALSAYFGPNYHPNFPEENAKLFNFVAFIPYLIGLRMRNISDYHKFINGDNCDDWITYMLDNDKIFEYLPLINEDESFSNKDNKNLVLKKERMKQIYDVIFKDKDIYSEEKIIGKMKFSNRQKDEIMRTVTLLSSLIKLDSTKG